MTPLAEIVDWGTIGEVIGYSLLAGVGLSMAFSLTLLGAIRFADNRRAGKDAKATAFAVLGVLGMAATLGALVLGIVVMTTKG
jgi:hypothetical protein